jgi:branched-chain amino acid transport system ATP-binding protein
MVGGLPTHEILRAGLRLVLDGHRIFPDISVRDNLRLGGAAARVSASELNTRIGETVAFFPILGEKLFDRARGLSGGQQQMLALGQAFVAKPRYLLCDEPSLGIAQALLPSILQFLKHMASLGVGVVVVEQHLDIALPFADRVAIVHRGRIVENCSSSEFLQRSVRTTG